MANELGKKRGIPKIYPGWYRKKMWAHPAARQLNIGGMNGIDSYNYSTKGAGYKIGSVTKYIKDIGNLSECFNCVQGPLGKKARLRREQNQAHNKVPQTIVRRPHPELMRK